MTTYEHGEEHDWRDEDQRAGDELKGLETLPDLGEVPPRVKPEEKRA